VTIKETIDRKPDFDIVAVQRGDGYRYFALVDEVMNAAQLIARQEERFIPDERQLSCAADKPATLVDVSRQRDSQSASVTIRGLALVFHATPEVILNPLAFNAPDDRQKPLPDSNIAVDRDVRDDVPVRNMCERFFFLSTSMKIRRPSTAITSPTRSTASRSR
jgi:hypothetical protein